jgi:hypothetical protein
MLGTALGTGVAGAIVTFGAVTLDSEITGLAMVFIVAAAVAVLGAFIGHRVPDEVHQT